MDNQPIHNFFIVLFFFLLLLFLLWNFQQMFNRSSGLIIATKAYRFDQPIPTHPPPPPLLRLKRFKVQLVTVESLKFNIDKCQILHKILLSHIIIN